MIRESSNWGLDISEFHKGHLWTVSCGVVYLRHVFVKGNAGRVLQYNTIQYNTLFKRRKIKIVKVSLERGYSRG